MSTEQSAVEGIKRNSGFLRGRIREELEASSPRFADEQTNLIKFHGIYQQEDRDARQARKAAGLEKAYQFMVRSRIPGGVLTAEQYLVHDALASRFANDTIRVTTRQGIQLHGVLKGRLRESLRAINDALLTTLAACGDVNRNVMACPAPAQDYSHGQVQAVAGAIARRLSPRTRAYHEIWLNGERVRAVGGQEDPDVEEPLYGPTYLPRKFKIGVAHPGDNCVDVYTQDIGLVAHVEGPGDEVTGFTVLVGGGMGSTHGKTTTYPCLATPLCYVPNEHVVGIVETIVTIQRDYGDRADRRHARMKYLVRERGIDWFAAETERRFGRPLEPPKRIFWVRVDDHLGWNRQHDGRWFVGVYVENGRIKDTDRQQLRSTLRRIIEEFHVGVRLTGQQNILLTGIADEDRPMVERLLAMDSVHTRPDELGIRRDAMACPALPTCGLALAEAERALPNVVAEIEEDVCELNLAGERISIRMTGCPNGCARPYMGDIGFVGKSKDLYNVYVGGDRENTRLNALFAEGVPTNRLRRVIRPLLELWRDERAPAEAFGDFCHRVGITALREKAAELVG